MCQSNQGANGRRYRMSEWSGFNASRFQLYHGESVCVGLTCFPVRWNPRTWIWCWYSTNHNRNSNPWSQDSGTSKDPNSAQRLTTRRPLPNFIYESALAEHIVPVLVMTFHNILLQLLDLVRTLENTTSKHLQIEHIMRVRGAFSTCMWLLLWRRRLQSQWWVIWNTLPVYNSLQWLDCWNTLPVYNSLQWPDCWTNYNVYTTRYSDQV